MFKLMNANKKYIETEYEYRLGPVVISQGIGDKLYGAFIVKPNGSLRRFVPIEMHPRADVVKFFLKNYRGRSIWKKRKGVCRVCGCTDEWACPGGCHWVEPDLCSACANGN